MVRLGLMITWIIDSETGNPISVLMYVAPPMRMGAWSMACYVWQCIINPSCNYHNRDCNELCKQFEADVFITSLIGYGSYIFSTGVLSPTLFST